MVAFQPIHRSTTGTWNRMATCAGRQSHFFFPTNTLRQFLTILVTCAALATTAVTDETACSIPSGANLNLPPTFWCSLIASVSIVNGCTTTVEETILLPWTTAAVNRQIPLQKNQNITVLSAVQRIGGNETPVTAAKAPQSTETNTVINMNVVPSKTEVQFLLRYQVSHGVHLFRHCSLLDFPDISPPQGLSTMLVKWAPGSASVGDIHELGVRFSLIRDSRNEFLDSPLAQAKDFSVVSSMDTSDTSKTIVVTHSGHAKGLALRRFIFYFRYALDAGWAECPISRSCVAEKEQLGEGENNGLKRGLVIGVCVALVLVAVAAILAIWFFCRSKGQGEQNGSGFNDGSLPKPLEHFAYDTGDEQSSAKWKKLTDVEMHKQPEEILAIALSPRIADEDQGERAGF